MTITKPTPNEPEWGLKLNAALDALDAKETIQGAADKASQAYTSAKEYSDARLNEVALKAGAVSSVVGKAGAVSASDVMSAIDAPLTTKLNTAVPSLINNTVPAEGSPAALALSAKIGTLGVWARDPDRMFSGAITRDSNNAPVSASVIWPDGATGTYTADAVSTVFPPAVDAYHVTRVVSGSTKTYTQPAVTRDGLGNVAVLPGLVVS